MLAMGDSDDDFVKTSSVRRRKSLKKKREVTGKMQLCNDIVCCPFDVMMRRMRRLPIKRSEVMNRFVKESTKDISLFTGNL